MNVCDGPRWKKKDGDVTQDQQRKELLARRCRVGTRRTTALVEPNRSSIKALLRPCESYTNISFRCRVGTLQEGPQPW
jgi:hypothetical protein